MIDEDEEDSSIPEYGFDPKKGVNKPPSAGKKDNSHLWNDESDEEEEDYSV